jgi:hypothetical protein
MISKETIAAEYIPMASAAEYSRVRRVMSGAVSLFVLFALVGVSGLR